MLRRLYWTVRGSINRWRFNRAFAKAPIKLLGPDTYVKEVWGNLYVVDAPWFAPDNGCKCHFCDTGRYD
jgi:hypothetical protein